MSKQIIIKLALAMGCLIVMGFITVSPGNAETLLNDGGGSLATWICPCNCSDGTTMYIPSVHGIHTTADKCNNAYLNDACGDGGTITGCNNPQWHQPKSERMIEGMFH